ncbi:conserved Plasmodium protein, unknown function [Plasmodium berghei]|uniref:Uncharacterized protein n=2 Tax=Plasmodium berghei TaxID=5821 RepID=A0A509AFS5_PLABA|nr:conserved Plasmodium protein, unknown function [Plasmodium berghei ANKA]CXI09504.1 conserved Plasmodium protein, unknown function [Plasmodium berghei]SCL92867.1 conserved Plasmodium protein, unknown function [Plasmodium berghei]SCM15740.1 conserved Plasmodium protein, unknown function [Plasmodium berghei]SCM17535.1 conserved Plasmodium protein, unknown function [Plasmodium berghei]SCN22954.1 conserved Plasmodium protein, unknown function [Plasmodium berghei]|eukprot:XP_034420346.1 conserved Plasmodium protein, unknown function [Plasmodium berghei ANKA]
MELVIKTPYIEIFEKILKLFASISENLNFRLTINKLELSGTNNISNHLIITIDKQFFKLSNVNYDGQMVVTGTVNSKDFYNCIFSNQIVKALKSQGSYAHNQNKTSNNNNETISRNYKNSQKNISSNSNESTSLNVSKLILKFNKENNSLEIGIKFKRYNTYCNAIIKTRAYNSPLKNYMYKNESIIQIEPTLFLLNLKDLSNERNIFLKSTDNSFIISALETSDFSLNKDKVKKEQFFYNNKKISIPLNKTIYFFKNKKFEDHSMSLPLNELKNIIKFCSDLNLLCLFSTKNFKENVIIYFGDIITNILKRNKKKIYNIKKEMNQINPRPNTYKKKETLCNDKNRYETESFAELSYEQQSEYSNNNEITSCIYYISDNSNSSDDYNSSFGEMEEDTSFSSEDEIKNSIYRSNINTTSHYNNRYDTDYNDIITGYIHFTSFFNISCNFNENTYYKNYFSQNNNVDVYSKEKLTAHIANEERKVADDNAHIEKQKKEKREISFDNSNINMVIKNSEHSSNHTERKNGGQHNNHSNDKKKYEQEYGQKYGQNYEQKDKDIYNISNDFLHKKINTLNLKINKSNDNTKNQNEEENKSNKQMQSKNNNINELNIPFEYSKKKLKNCFFYKNDFKTDQNEDSMNKHGKDITLNVNKEENIFKEKYEKENDNIKQINESEYFNYDKFMSKDNISEVYVNMDSQIKKLNKTLKNINKYKKKKTLMSTKWNNDVFFSNNHNNFKMKRKRPCDFIPNLNHINKNVKNRQINNNRYTNSICSSGTEKYISNKNREIQSDTYYSFSDDSLVEKSQNENGGNINYIKYFNNVYSKYDLCNNFIKLKNNINHNSYKEYDPYMDNYHKNINISPLNYNKNSKYRRINTDIDDEIIKGNTPNYINYKNNHKIFYNNNLIYKKTC